MERRTQAVLAAAAACLVLASAPPAWAARSGSQTFANGNGSLVVSWSFGCGTATTDTTTWRPWVDVRVREVGNTNWRSARVVYRVRATEETRVVKSWTADIRPPDSVLDPPLWRSSALPWDPYGDMVDFAPAVGFRVAVETASGWTTLKAQMLSCTNPTP